MKHSLVRIALFSAAFVLLTLGSTVTAWAADDDDLPGTPLAVGSSVSGSVSATDASDVYAIDLVAGQEVHIRCDPGKIGSATGALHLIVPGAQSLATSHYWDELTYELEAGSPSRYWADYDYIAAKSGTYYLWIGWESGVLDYALTVSRTSRAALDLAQDSDDVPGTAVGAGTYTGVISTFADPVDLYAVELVAGRTATFRLIPLTPYSNHFIARAYLNLLDPDTPSLAKRSGHVLAGLVEAANDLDVGSRKIAQIVYTPTESGTYYIWIDAPTAPYGHNFAYQLSISGSADDTTQPPTFSDIDGSPYAGAIMALATRDVIRGFTDGTFRPDAIVTRQQFAKMIVKALDLTVTGGEVCPFTDVESALGSDPFYPDKYVAVCAVAEITKGTSATTFSPYEDITRQQLVTMVVRAAGLADPPAGYAPSFLPGQFFPEEHYLSARRAAYAGLLDSISGVGPAFEFFAASSRGECAQMLFNLLNR